MAPHLPVRQLLTWSLPSVAILLSYLWYKKRRIGAPSDSGGSSEEQKVNNTVADQTLIEEEEETRITTTPQKLARSLSGVETTPINIVYPRKQLKHSKSHSPPAHISDEDLDLEIEKIKSMRNHNISPSTISAKTPSPVKSESQKSTESSASSPDSVVRKESFNHSPVKKNIGSTPLTTVSPTASISVQKATTTPVTSPTTSVTNSASPKKNKGTTKGKTDKPKMVQKEEVVEGKAIKMTKEIDNSSPPKTNEKEDTRDQIRRRNSSGRDSANHSPCDLLVTASPILSFISDNHSEGSNDSGKGCSDAATPPPSSQADNVPTNYEFVIAQNLVGKLIGRQGVFVQRIKEKCNADVYVSDHPTNTRLKLCSIEGTHAEIDKALKMIRDRFPLKKYSEVSLEKVVLAPVVPTVSLIPDHLYLKLVEGINNDTILSCMVAPDHLFMQQPTHPAFPSLDILSNCMNHCYENQPDSPLLPTPIPDNTVCVAYSEGAWYRAVVLSSNQETDSSYIKFLDYGGYCYVENDKLRQIRQDFMLLPFQAAECFLANVKPKSEDGTWPQGAYDLVANTTKGSVIYTQIADYTPDRVPLVLCYVILNSKTVIFINQKLVDEGYADWVDFDDTVPA